MRLISTRCALRFVPIHLVAAAQARAGRRSRRARRPAVEDPMVGVAVMAAERDMRRDDGDLMSARNRCYRARKLYAARKGHGDRGTIHLRGGNALRRTDAGNARHASRHRLRSWMMLAIETNQLAWLESMAANAARSSRPDGQSSEPLRVESEVAQERQKIDSTARQRTRLMRQINILLGRAADQP